jgi:hypothetical protein
MVRKSQAHRLAIDVSRLLLSANPGHIYQQKLTSIQVNLAFPSPNR